jgi:hypothetical protein
VRELIDYDPDTGEKMFLCKDADGFFLRQEHDVAPVIEQNKKLQNEDFDRKSDMWHAASVPIGVQYEWLVKFGVDFWNPAHKGRVMKLLDDPDYRYLRVNKFIIGAKD